MDIQKASFWIEIAGITCIPWSSLGKQEGWLHESALPCLTLVKSIMQFEPDAFVCECTRTFDDKKKAEMVKPKFLLRAAIISPTVFGIPSSRWRKYMIGTHLKRITMQVDYSSEALARTFGRQCVLDGSVYLRADDARNATITRLAQERQYEGKDNKNKEIAAAAITAIKETKDECSIGGHAPSGSSSNSTSLPTASDMNKLNNKNSEAEEIVRWRVLDVMSRGYGERGIAYETWFKTFLGGGSGSSGPGIVNLTQNLERQAGQRHCAMHVPALAQASVLYCIRDGKLFEPLEHMSVQGVPVHSLIGKEDADSLPACYFPFVEPMENWPKKVLSDGLLRSLTGNAMHLSQVGSVLLFLLAHAKQQPLPETQCSSSQGSGDVHFELQPANPASSNVSISNFTSEGASASESCSYSSD